MAFYDQIWAYGSGKTEFVIEHLYRCAKKCTDFTMSYLQKYWIWRLSMGWNSILKNLMWLTHSIKILLIFENQQIIIIPKITSKIVLDISE